MSQTITVTHVGEGWKATPTSDPLFTIHVEGMGEPQKTYDAALATEGTHEAESYQSSTGKTYWRTPGSQRRGGGGAAKVMKADPEKLKQEFTLEVARNQSIQRQVAVKGTVDLIVAGKVELKDLHMTYVNLMALLTEPEWERFGPGRDHVLTDADLSVFDEEVDALEDLPV